LFGSLQSILSRSQVYFTNSDPRKSLEFLSSCWNCYKWITVWHIDVQDNLGWCVGGESVIITASSVLLKLAITDVCGYIAWGLLWNFSVSDKYWAGSAKWMDDIFILSFDIFHYIEANFQMKVWKSFILFLICKAVLYGNICNHDCTITVCSIFHLWQCVVVMMHCREHCCNMKLGKGT